MTEQAELLFLGSGGSLGIPVVGCSCPVCLSSDEKNKRLRPAALLTLGKLKILIDCGPDIRQQMLRAKIDHIDGVILTHSHYDHVEGIDELRVFAIRDGKKRDCLLSQDTLKELQERFGYIFRYQDSDLILTSRLNFQLFPKERGEVVFLNHRLRYFTFQQMGMNVQGIRVGNLAYVSDIKNYPETIFEDLSGVEILILSALRLTDSRMHFSVKEAVAFAKKVGARETYLMHISHDLDHEKTGLLLPKNIRLAYDGLQIPFNAEAK